MKRPLTLSILLSLAIVTTAAAAPKAPVLPFIHDDYARALAVARSSQRPLFVEAWAPW
jgi:hypothetical protein